MVYQGFGAMALKLGGPCGEKRNACTLTEVENGSRISTVPREFRYPARTGLGTSGGLAPRVATGSEIELRWFILRCI